MDETIVLELQLQVNQMKQKLAEMTQKTEEFSKKFDKQNKNNQKSMGRFAGSISAAKVVAVAAFAAMVVAGRAFYGFMMNTAIPASIEQEKALNNLATQMKLTGEFSQEAFKGMQDFASGIQATTTVGDEAALGMMAYAKSMGATNQQAKDLTMAAIELSAATGKSTDESIRQVSKTLGGFAGELGEVNPKIKELSAEQLKNGEAAKILLAQYGGSAQSQLNTYAGVVDQSSNKMGDMFEKIGDIVTRSPLFIKLIKMAGDAFDVMGTFIEENQTAIQEYIQLGLVKIIEGAQLVIKYGLEPMATAFSFITSAAKMQRNLILSIIGGMVTFVTDKIGLMIQKVREGFELLPERFQPSWVSDLKEMEDKMKTFSDNAFDYTKDKVNETKDAFKGMWSALTDEQVSEDFKESLNNNLETVKKGIQNTSTQLNESTKTIGDNAADGLEKKEKKTAGFFTELLTLDENQKKNRVQNFKDSMNLISGLMASESKELFMIGKASSIAMATVDGILAVQKALASAPAPFNFVLAGLVGTATAVNIAKIASTPPPAYRDGGVVGGFIGASAGPDNINIQARRGEMFLNASQQRNMFDMINNGGGSSPEMINLLVDIRDNLGRQDRNVYMNGERVNEELNRIDSRRLA